MHSFRASSLWVLLGVFILRNLTLALGDVGCNTCSGAVSVSGDSFTVRNALPFDDNNVHMVCSFINECGSLDVRPPVDLIPCQSFEITASSSTALVSDPRIQQVLCEFTWTRTTSETYQRALVLVWSRDVGAPQNTYYKIDKSAFWFASTKYGNLTQIGTWSTPPNLMSAEPVIVGPGIYKANGHSLCRSTSTATHY